MATEKTEKKTPAKSTSKRKRQITPINEENGIIQPIVFTMMRQSYSKIQNRAVVCVVDKLQNVFHDMLNRGIKRFEDIQTSEIINDKGLSIKIGFNEFGVSPNEYPDLRTALKNLAMIPVEIPYKSAEGRMYDRYTNMCDVYIPRDTYSKFVIITIEREVAQRLISMEFGYQNLYKTVVVNNCKNKYAQRMYMICTAWQNKGKVIMRTDEFRKLLAIDNMYPEFRHVRSRVLEPAKKELEELASAEGADCYFDYRLIYLNGKKKGEPDQIEFTIMKSKKDVTDSYVGNLEVIRRNYDEMLRRHFKFTSQESAKYSSRITAENYTQALEKLQTVYMYVNDLNNGIQNAKAYAIKSLDNFFAEKERAVEV